MTGLIGQRVYLDWNATAPLRPEAREAMLVAMDTVGNPSSVHAEGRAANKIIETARGQVAALVGCEPSEVVFTSGATEAAAIAFAGADHVYPSPVEHDCVLTHGRNRPAPAPPHNVAWREAYAVDADGIVGFADDQAPWTDDSWGVQLFAVQAASGETGICQGTLDVRPASMVRDVVQSVFRIAADWTRDADILLASGHKLGGPKGVGALVARGAAGSDVARETPLRGGGQEQGRRSGTENVIGIAGFGAAAEAAQRDLEADVWEPVEKLRNILESRLADAAKETIFFGQESPRLPNTSCFAVPGWKGETQVMQMDLSGFAVSAGSACSSGKVNKASRVLMAMGFDELTASSAIRVSMGPTTTEAEVMAFADTWIEAYRRRKARAA
ncbi:MAG: cysteine desulfurase family protein [Paracoccaceae bacterium]